MGKLHIAIVALLIFANLTHSLHFQRAPQNHFTTNPELQALRSQQADFEKSVNAMISNISDIQSKVNKSSSTDDKVLILENAITSERQQIFDMSNKIIPPFNLSKNACEELTNEQKISLLDQVSKAKIQIAVLKNMSASLPPCEQITLINRDIQKQTVIIESIQKIIYTKCQSSIILSPTIFQSNIYASNWILGNQTIDDLIEEYYQRSMQYPNVTNCPSSFPFFDGKNCINCTGTNPVFNMYIKKCDSCPFDTTINTDLRTCQQIPHSIDFSIVQNYMLDNTTAPQASSLSLTPCNPQKPYFNGSCVSCKLPYYWSIKDNLCKSCSAGNVFDVNSKTCTPPSGQSLSILQGTNWVTNDSNITRVLKLRAGLFNNTNTSLCTQDSPFYDGIKCISCPNEFNLDSNKCSTAPLGMVYDDNVHGYVVPQTKETNPQAKNILSSTPLPDSAAPNCNTTNPYFDGIACINCQAPFILFDTSSKKCVVCDADEIYNSSSLQCETRQSLYISTNFNNLLATKNAKVDDYKKDLLNKIQNNGDQLVQKCPDPAQYSNYTTCFKCNAKELFNIQSKKCDICNGTIDTTTNLCIPKSTLLTNLGSAPNLLLPSNKTISDYTKEQASNTGPVDNCPSTAPYSVNGITCIACTSPNIYFDLQAQKCTSCPNFTAYNNKTRICDQGHNVTNTAALKNYIQIDNYTLANIQKQNDLLAQTKYTITCSASQPIFDGKKCTFCPSSTYINLKTLQCIGATKVTNVAQLKNRGNYFETDNYTIQNIAQNIKNLAPNPTVACDASQPVFNGVSCYSCPNDKFYNLKTNQCVSAILVTNVAALTNLTNVKQAGNYTLKNIELNIKASTLPVQACDPSQPLYDGKKCIFCDSYSIYDLQNSACILPQLYTNVTAIKTTKYFQTDNYTLANINASNAKIPHPNKPCPADQPIFNGVSCISCPVATYYNLKTSNCFAPVFVSNTIALSNSQSYVEVDNGTLNNLALAIKNITLPTTVCNATTPLFDGTKCISCPQSLYNLKTLQCFNCTIDQYYNSTLLKCLSKPHYYPNLTNYNWIVSDSNGIDRVINFTAARSKLDSPVPCPAGSEFFNNKTLNCQSCPNGTFFNYDQWTCVSCPAGQQIDINTHKCNTRTVGISQTNLKSDNLIFGGLPLNQFNDYYSSNTTTYTKIQDCPLSQPYFDGFECIQCRPQIPYFSLVYKMCMNCPSPAVYDPVAKDCRANGKVQNSPPNPAKMFSSIF